MWQRQRSCWGRSHRYYSTPTLNIVRIRGDAPFARTYAPNTTHLATAPSGEQENSELDVPREQQPCDVTIRAGRRRVRLATKRSRHRARHRVGAAATSSNASPPALRRWRPLQNWAFCPDAGHKVLALVRPLRFLAA